MGQHWFLLTVLGFVLAAAVGFGVWWVYMRLMMWSTKYQHRYSKIPTLVTPPGVSPTRRPRGVMPTLLRRVSFKDDEEAGKVTETSYELFSRRD